MERSGPYTGLTLAGRKAHASTKLSTNGWWSFAKFDPIPEHKPMRPRKLPHVVDEPEQHIVGLRDGGWKAARSFLGHEHPDYNPMPRGEAQRAKIRRKGNRVKG